MVDNIVKENNDVSNPIDNWDILHNVKQCWISRFLQVGAYMDSCRWLLPPDLFLELYLNWVDAVKIVIVQGAHVEMADVDAIGIMIVEMTNAATSQIIQTFLEGVTVIVTLEQHHRHHHHHHHHALKIVNVVDITCAA